VNRLYHHYGRRPVQQVIALSLAIVAAGWAFLYTISI
jgi:hypothetical protein